MAKKPQKTQKKITLKKLAEDLGVHENTTINWKKRGILKEKTRERMLAKATGEIAVETGQTVDELKEAIKFNTLSIINIYGKEFKQEGIDLSLFSEEKKILLGLKFLEILVKGSK